MHAQCTRGVPRRYPEVSSPRYAVPPTNPEVIASLCLLLNPGRKTLREASLLPADGRVRESRRTQGSASWARRHRVPTRLSRTLHQREEKRGVDVQYREGGGVPGVGIPCSSLLLPVVYVSSAPPAPPGGICPSCSSWVYSLSLLLLGI